MIAVRAEFVCYDDGCHLRKFACNTSRSTLSETTTRIVNIEIVLDKFHYSNHTDEWCKRTCNLWNFRELDKVSEQQCMCM